MLTILFLCTGNYFRSRLAERLFNHRATEAGLPWQASSRSLAPRPELRNVGPISEHCLRALGELGVSVEIDRGPLEATVEDLRDADRIIAVNEREHRPMVLDRFPSEAPRVEYWACEDIGSCEPALACHGVVERVEELVRSLSPGQT